MRFWRGCGGSTSQCTIEYFTYSGNQRQILNEHKRASRQVTVITGAGSGIGRAVAISLAKQGVKALGLVDRDDSVQTIAEMINKENGNGQKIAEPFLGYTADEVFRKQTFDRIVAQYGTPTICVGDHARPTGGQDRQGDWACSPLPAGQVPARGRGEPDRSRLFVAAREHKSLGPITWSRVGLREQDCDYRSRMIAGTYSTPGYRGENSRNGISWTASVNPPRKQRMSFRPQSVTYGKIFHRAFAREKRYLTCVNFPLLCSPLSADCREDTNRQLGISKYSSNGVLFVF